MTFWDWLSRIGPGWPTERQWVTIALVVTLWIMLQMAVNNPQLWDVKLFEILIQGFALTGMLNMVLAFHFAANKSDEDKSANTGKMADAMRAVAEKAGPSTDREAVAAQQVAEAADRKADEFRAPAPVDYRSYPPPPQRGK